MVAQSEQFADDGIVEESSTIEFPDDSVRGSNRRLREFYGHLHPELVRRRCEEISTALRKLSHRNFRISEVQRDMDGAFFVQIHVRFELPGGLRNLRSFQVLGTQVVVESRFLEDLYPRVETRLRQLELDIRTMRDALREAAASRDPKRKTA